MGGAALIGQRNALFGHVYVIANRRFIINGMSQIQHEDYGELSKMIDLLLGKQLCESQMSLFLEGLLDIVASQIVLTYLEELNSGGYDLDLIGDQTKCWCIYSDYSHGTIGQVLSLYRYVLSDADIYARLPNLAKQFELDIYSGMLGELNDSYGSFTKIDRRGNVSVVYLVSETDEGLYFSE